MIYWVDGRTNVPVHGLASAHPSPPCSAALGMYGPAPCTVDKIVVVGGRSDLCVLQCQRWHNISSLSRDDRSLPHQHTHTAMVCSEQYSNGILFTGWLCECVCSRRVAYHVTSARDGVPHHIYDTGIKEGMNYRATDICGG